MNYSQIYQNLIRFRKENPPIGYTENHHIIPRSMGGSDNKDNLVKLTGREHWVAHLLLWRIHKNSQCLNACHMMAMRCEERGISQIRNSRMYEAVRIQHSMSVSIKMQSSVAEKNSQFGTRWINDGMSESRKIRKGEITPDGWLDGRIVWPEKHTAAKENAKRIEDRRALRSMLVQTQSLVRSTQEKTSRGYRKKATDQEILDALKLCDYDIIKAKAHLGYQLEGGNSTKRFQKILSSCRP